MIKKLFLALFSALLISICADAADYKGKVDRIWDQGYSSFTGITKFRGNYYVTFREGGGHVFDQNGIAHGMIRILKSKNGDSWESVALLETEGHDLRDPKLSVTPDGRLMVSMGGSVYVGKDLVARHPFVSFSKDGKTFSDPQRSVLGDGLDPDASWIWRVTWHKGVGYGTNYADKHVEIVTTKDGVHYEKAEGFSFEGFPNESTIRFTKDGRMTMFVRHDDGDHAHWGVKTDGDWDWKDIPYYLGGPDHLIYGKGKNAKVILSGRRWVPTRTAIFVGDLDGNFEEVLSLPSGGDTSYPGLMIVGKELWVVYYSCHELGRAAIYFTKIPLRDLGLK